MDFSKHNDTFSITISHMNYGAITNYSVLYEKDPDSSDGSKHFVITIKRRMDFQFERDLIDIYSSAGFEIAITRGNERVIFPLAVAQSVLEEIGDDKLLYQTMVFTTKHRRTEIC